MPSTASLGESARNGKSAFEDTTWMKILRIMRIASRQQSGCNDPRVEIRVNQIALRTAVMVVPAAVTWSARHAKEESSP